MYFTREEVEVLISAVGKRIYSTERWLDRILARPEESDEQAHEIQHRLVVLERLHQKLTELLGQFESRKEGATP